MTPQTNNRPDDESNAPQIKVCMITLTALFALGLSHWRKSGASKVDQPNTSNMSFPCSQNCDCAQQCLLNEIEVEAVRDSIDTVETSLADCATTVELDNEVLQLDGRIDGVEQAQADANAEDVNRFAGIERKATDQDEKLEQLATDSHFHECKADDRHADNKAEVQRIAKCSRGVTQIVVDGCYGAMDGLRDKVVDLQADFETTNQQTTDDQDIMWLAVAENDEELQLQQLEIQRLRVQLEESESRRATAISAVHLRLDSLTGVFNELPLGLLSDDVVPLLEALRRYCKKRVLKAAAKMQPDTAPKRRRSNRILGVAPTDVEDCAPRRLAE